MRIATSIAVLALSASAAAAQTGEIFIPGKTPTIEVQPVQPTNRMAACLAAPNAANCTGVSADSSGVAFESATGLPTVTFETLILNLDDGYVEAKPEPPSKPVDYAAPVKPTNYQPPNNDGTYKPPTNDGTYKPPANDGTYKPPTNHGDYANNAPYNGKIELPSVAITIEFDYNSAYIRADQIGKIAGLTSAFQDPALQTYSFAVIGHTDAAGSYGYNCDLSRKRANEVTNALRGNYVNLALYPVGFGEHVLKNKYDPRSGENRRVTFLRLPQDYRPVLDTTYAVCAGY